MNVGENSYFIEECMKDIVCEVNKKVRDSILLGKAKLSKVNIFFIQTQSNFDENEDNQSNISKHYLTYKIKEFKLSQTLEKKKTLQKNLLKLDQKIIKLKHQVEPKYEIELKKNRYYVDYSPRLKIGKIPKLSDDVVIINHYKRKENKRKLKQKNLSRS